MQEIILKNKLTNETKKIKCDDISIFKSTDWEVIYCEDVNIKNTKKKGNGEGTLYYSETLQKWVGQYSINYKRKTMTQRKNEGVNEFKKRFRDTLASIDNGTYIERNNETLYEIIDRHIEQKFKDKITSARSYKRNKETLKAIEKTCSNFIHKPVQKITPEDIEDAKPLISEYSSEVIDKIWGILKIGFKIAISRRKIRFNIMDDVTLTKPISNKKKIKKEALTIKEEKALRDVLNNQEKNHKYRDIVLTQLNTGMRIGEVLARSLTDANLKKNSLHIWNTLTQDENYKIIISEHTKIYDKKNQIDRGERTIPLDKEVKEIILKIKNSNLKNIYNLLFWDYEKNTFISPAEINSWLRRLNKKYKITNKSLTTHILRHSRITRLQEAGVLLVVIQYFVGHVEGSKDTNDTYTTVSFDFAKSELKKVK